MPAVSLAGDAAATGFADGGRWTASGGRRPVSWPLVTGESRKNPWWISGRTLQAARTSAFLYTAVFALYGSVAIGTGGAGRNPWTIVLIVLWGLLTVWGWFSVWWFVRRSR
jgi:hypothetical protein